ncbi:MAG: GTP-binding protein [Alphaproteobacteria bacterium]|nr:GTP-binding protein [Alphaproteobacteria bacterium]
MPKFQLSCSLTPSQALNKARRIGERASSGPIAPNTEIASNPGPSLQHGHSQPRHCARRWPALPSHIIRGKGVLYCDDSLARPVVFHLVGRRATFSPSDVWPAPSPSSQLVLIGARAPLNSAELESIFTAALG